MVLGDSDDPEVEADDDAEGDEDGDQKVRYRAGVAPKIFSSLAKRDNLFNKIILKVEVLPQAVLIKPFIILAGHQSKVLSFLIVTFF